MGNVKRASMWDEEESKSRPKKLKKKTRSERKINKYKNYLEDDTYLTFEKLKKKR